MNFSPIALQVPTLLLPGTGVDLTRWAVAACDQYTSQPDWGDYYVRLRVKPDAGDLNLNVVRVSTDQSAASNEQARRDREMEEHWCAAHRELLHRLEQRGIASQPLRAHAPGELPVQCVPPDAAQHAHRTQIRRTGGSLQQREI